MVMRCFVLVTAALLGVPVQAQQEEAHPSPLPRAPIIVPAPLAIVRHVKLDLRFDLVQRHASGTATLDLLWRGDPDTLRLDAAALDIHSVHTADGHTLAYRYDGSAANSALRIALPAGYASGDPLTLVIAYRTTHVNESDPNNLGGSNGKGLRFFGPTTTEPRKRRQVWSMAELGSNRYWFPGCDRLGVHHTTELLATVDADLEALSNGELIATTPNKDGTHTFHWRDDRPHANHQVVLAIGQWTDVPQRWNNVALHNHSYPDEVEATAASVVRLPDMMAFFSAYTGVPYPAESYRQVFVQDLPWGMYGRGTSVQTENMVDDFGTHADFFYLWDGLQAEALAHQWYGSAITSGESGIETAATGGEVGELFEYRIDQPVTVRRDRSALIPILQTKMEGERVSLYNEATRKDRPMTGIRLKNTSPLTLEGGSLTVLDGDAYAGEALIERLKAGEQRFISFGLDLSTLVTTKFKSERRPVFLVRATKGVFETHYHRTERKTYTLLNQTDKKRTVYIEHPLRDAWKLSDDTQAPASKTTSYYRFRVELEPRETKELPITETQVLMDSYQLYDLSSRDVELFVSSNYIDAGIKAELEKLIDLKVKIAKAQGQLERLEQEAEEISDDQKRLRDNISTLKNTNEAKQLVTRYIAKAGEQETRLEAIAKEKRELQTEVSQLTGELGAAVRALNLERKL
jgi:hypothetical protein